MQGLAFPAVANDTVIAHHRQMLGQRRLTETDAVSQFANGHLARCRQLAKDEQPPLVSQQLHQAGRRACLFGEVADVGSEGCGRDGIH